MASKDRLIQVGSVDRDDESVCLDSECFNFALRDCNEISQIFISAGEVGITSIEFQYEENGKYVLSDRYGYGSNTNKFHTIELNHPAEHITGVSGLYYGTNVPISVISFTTNIKVYGPFGKIDSDLLYGNSKSFTFNLGNSRQFGGFHGIYNSLGLISIGLYLSAKTLTPSALARRFRRMKHQ